MSFSKLTVMYGVMRRQEGCRNWFYLVLGTEDTSMFHNLALIHYIKVDQITAPRLTHAL
jgi:hypothetical protein